ACLLIAKAGSQILLQNFDRRMIQDAAHVLSHFEATFAGFLAFYCLGRILDTTNRNQNKLLFQAGFVIAAGTVVLSNFRAVWLGFIAASMVMFWVQPFSHKLRGIIIGLIGMIALIGSLMLAWNVPIGEKDFTIGREITKKLEKTRDFNRDANIDWRFQS